VLPPSSCTPAHQLNMRSWKKVPDFVATTENISVIDVLLVLKPKHSSYWEGNELCPSQNQDTTFHSFIFKSFGRCTEGVP